MHSAISTAFALWRRGVYDPFVLLNALELRRALRGCNSVLDVGCGCASPLQYLGLKGLVGIDGYAPAIESARKLGTHSDFVLGDIRDLPRVFKDGQFDACVALDVIEHLPKEDGFRLIEGMSRIAKKRVIFLTPNGFLPQRHQERDDLQEHLSGWSAEEMAGLGFQVFGMLGPKALRGEFHRITKTPRAFWALYSLFRQLTHSKRHPATAAAILFTKDSAR